jgi:hypothetical protein
MEMTEAIEPSSKGMLDGVAWECLRTLSVDLDDRLVDPEGRKRRKELRTPKPLHERYRPPEWDPPYPTSTHSGVTTHLRAMYQVGNAQLMIIQTRLNRVEIKSKMRVTGSSSFNIGRPGNPSSSGAIARLGRPYKTRSGRCAGELTGSSHGFFRSITRALLGRLGCRACPRDRSPIERRSTDRLPSGVLLHRGSAQRDRADGLRDECEGSLSKERRRDGGRSFCSHAQQPVAAFDGTSLGMKSSARTAYATPEDRGRQPHQARQRVSWVRNPASGPHRVGHSCEESGATIASDAATGC